MQINIVLLIMNHMKTHSQVIMQLILTIQIALTHNKFLPELSILMQLDQILDVFQFQIS